MQLCSANKHRHYDTAGHSVKCSPTAGTFRLHRRTAPPTDLIDFTTAITSLFCGRLSEIFYCPTGQDEVC